MLAPEDLTPQRAPHGGVAQDSDRLRGQHWNSILLSSAWFEAKSDSYEYLQTLLYRYVRKMYQGDASPYWCEDWTELRSLQSKKKNQLNHRPSLVVQFQKHLQFSGMFTFTSMRQFIVAVYVSAVAALAAWDPALEYGGFNWSSASSATKGYFFQISFFLLLTPTLAQDYMLFIAKFTNVWSGDVSEK